MQKKIFLNLILYISAMCVSQESAVTTSPWTGRLGDQLVYWAKTWWIAEKLLKLPYLWKPFKYSEQLVLYNTGKKFDETIKFQRISKYTGVSTKITDHTLYEVDYGYNADFWPTLAKDAKFVEELRLLIAPINNLKLIQPPIDKLSIAVHIRKGTGFDPFPLVSSQEYESPIASKQKRKIVGMDQLGPLKFPPNQYYIDQLAWLSQKLHEFDLYVFIFTDDPNPETLVNIFKKHIKTTNITYDYRAAGNFHDSNVLTDFFSIAYNFDFFIRGGSNFAAMAELIGAHKVVIRPLAYKWEKEKLLITQRDIVCKNEILAELLQIPLNDGTDHFCPS